MPLVILDRDGVINHNHASYIKSPDEWKPIAGALEAIAKLNHAGFRVVVATNQSGLARKLFDIETLGRIHQKMQRSLNDLGGSIEAIFFCPHVDKDKCLCRKPKPGLLLDIAERLQIDLEAVPFIGDTLHDAEAAQAVQARPMLVRTGLHPLELADDSEVEIYDDLSAAADQLIGEMSVR